MDTLMGVKNEYIIRTISISGEHDAFLKSHREINFSEVCRKKIEELMENSGSEYGSE